MDNTIEIISNYGIVPVVQIDRKESALGLAEALIAGGLPCAEITFRTEAAEDSLRIISQKHPGMFVGAGTVLTVEQAKRAVDAGAKFIVSPGLNPKVVTYCLENNIPIIPGVSSPSDIEAAMDLGLSVVKFFPAEASGGMKYLKALAAPYGKMKFLPTGGISAENLNEYLSFGSVIACGGSWMVSPKLINGGDFAAITALTKTAVSAMQGFRLVHIGVNTENDAQAESIAKLFCMVLDMPLVTKPESYFTGDVVEVMRQPNFGKNGYIGIECNSIKRAVFFMRAKESSLRRTDIGTMLRAI